MVTAELFAQRFRELAGQVHTVSDDDEAIALTTKILTDRGVRRVAVGGVALERQRILMNALGATGMEVVVAGQGTTLAQLASVDAGITQPALAVAETGSLVEFTTDDAVRLVSSLPRIHVAHLEVTRILSRLSDVSWHLRRFYEHEQRHGIVTFIAGPSRTGDIENRLVLGVHGPHEAHVILQERR